MKTIFYILAFFALALGQYQVGILLLMAIFFAEISEKNERMENDNR